MFGMSCVCSAMPMWGVGLILKLTDSDGRENDVKNGFLRKFGADGFGFKEPRCVPRK